MSSSCWSTISKRTALSTCWRNTWSKSCCRTFTTFVILLFRTFWTNILRARFRAKSTSVLRTPYSISSELSGKSSESTKFHTRKDWMCVTFSFTFVTTSGQTRFSKDDTYSSLLTGLKSSLKSTSRKSFNLLSRHLMKFLRKRLRVLSGKFWSANTVTAFTRCWKRCTTGLHAQIN